MKISVISDGAWATAIALLLIKNKHSVHLWGPFPEYIEEMKLTRKNTRYLKGQALPDEITLTHSMSEAIDKAELIVMASPTQYARKCLQQISEFGLTSNQIIVNVSKGIETGSLNRISQICTDVIGDINYVVLSGPSHAEEVVKGMPTAVVAASDNPDISQKVQNSFMNPVFRVYTTGDVTGVELGGALKNVYAIAAGISDGMGLGDNSKAALITRGIAEMARLGVALGGRQETFSGLSGVGDMIVTCASSHSRNRFVGEQMGKGLTLKAIKEKMGFVVAEGVETTKSAHALAKKWNVDTPIINEVYSDLYEGKNPKHGLTELMTRKAKTEFE